MNGLKVCAADIGNAYLNGRTREKVYVIAGPEFGPEIRGKRMIIDKALYGLKSSGARFHEHLSAKLRKMGYRPSKADSDLWYKWTGTHYEYIARYVDDVISFSKDPLKVMKELEKIYVLKGVGRPEYYLGGDVMELNKQWIPEGIEVAFSAETYLKNTLPKLTEMLNIKQFSKYKTPFNENYHPELDDTDFLCPKDISKYKSLIGSANWLVTLGRFDIQYATSTMAQYSMAPRKGHLEAVKRIFGYLSEYYKARLPIDINDPGIRNEITTSTDQEWMEFYPDACEEIPYDMLKPVGKTGKITVYVDADHARDKVTRRSVTGIVLLLGNTPIVWISKRQRTVETSTYGAELVAARIAVDLIVEMRYKLRMLGIKVENRTFMIGDNMSVVINTTIPSSGLRKKHLSCAYHRVREAIAGGFVIFGHIPSEKNLADINTKPLSNGAFHSLIGPYLFRTPMVLNKKTTNKVTE